MLPYNKVAMQSHLITFEASKFILDNFMKNIILRKSSE